MTLTEIEHRGKQKLLWGLGKIIQSSTLGIKRIEIAIQNSWKNVKEAVEYNTVQVRGAISAIHASF